MDAQKDDELRHLLCRAQEGDNSAYKAFLQEVAAELRPYLSRRIERQDQMEDVLQETLLSIHRARHSYLPGRPLSPWLYAIAQNRVTDFFRRYRALEKREIAMAEEFDVPQENTPVRENSVRADQAIAALKKLPKSQRLVVELLKIESLSVREVALKLGMSEGAVKVAASRGYKAIRKALGVKQDED